MSGDFLRDYMVMPVGFSGGASGTGSMLRWTHAQLPTSTRGRSFWAGSGEDAGGSVHVMWYRDAATGDLESDFPRERLLCHFLLAELPDTAIEEALDTLADLWRYHVDTALTSLNVSPAPARIDGGHVLSTRRSDPVLIAEG